ncbi:MAG: FecR domain-containing protein [Verrucomicrobiaceae bacterium]|nr:FecR domain-containing protein [Verrucomicrobiaceae bacterium]
MSTTGDNIPWELLTRYAAGECDAPQAAELSRRIENDPALAAALAEVLLQAVAVRDDAEAHPERPVIAVVKPRWRSAVILSAAAAITLLISIVWLIQTGGERHILTVMQADGSVRWTGAGGEVRETLANGSTLPGGTLETVSDDATLVISFADGTTLTLLGRSLATLSDDGQKNVHLRSGSLSADVRPQPARRPLRIHTPTALLEVLGTRFEVDSDDANTRLAVNEGRVRLTRLIDGRSADVPAQHETIASLSGAEMPVMPRRQPEVLWRSDLAAGPAGTQGRWLPAEGDIEARLATEPVFLPKSSRGPVTIHRVGLTLPWQNRANIHVQPDSRLRVRGRAKTTATLEVMLACMKAKGGYAGNWFQQRRIEPGTWQIELPVSAFRHWHAQAQDAPQEPLELRQIAIYTISTDAGLEVGSVEVLRE